MQTYQLSDLVSEALAYFEAHPEPIEKVVQEYEEPAAEEELLSEDSELEE